MRQESFKGKHFIIHLNEGMDRLNKNELKEYPFNIMVASEYAHPPMNKEELKGLADFIYETIGEKK